jgi:hypothetical protein
MGRNVSFTQLMSLTGHKKFVPLMALVSKRVTWCRQAQTFGRIRPMKPLPSRMGRNVSFTGLMSLTGHKKFVPLMENSFP